jgi:hypothetical protein
LLHIAIDENARERVVGGRECSLRLLDVLMFSFHAEVAADEGESVTTTLEKKCSGFFVMFPKKESHIDNIREKIRVKLAETDV